jgi:aminoglycoside phosphotransferase (APT) family kinase protein
MPEAEQFLEELRRDGHVHDPQARLTPLSGGVSSEIYLVQDGAEKFVVKRALAKLKVKEDWLADVSRNASEWSYLECVGRLLPGTVPQLLFANRQAGYFGMEFLGAGHANWKEMLLSGDCREEHAQLAGKILGEIHRRTRGNDALRKQFDTTANFRQLRLEPYLGATASRHPQLREIFAAEARRIETTRESLVHGDFSPKNILIRGDRMVLLDCEVAWYGDPAFDVAFLLNHLFLKSLRHAPRDVGIDGMIARFRGQYLASSATAAEKIEPRVVRLLPLLLLARVDGKSPVEYLDLARQDFIRDFVREELRQGGLELAPFLRAWLDKSRSLQPIAI